MATRNRFLTFLGLLTLFCAGCGGGGAALAPAGSPGDVSQSPSLRGVVVDAEGSTAALAGYRFVLEQTGEEAVTDGSGQFAFADVPTGPIDVHLVGAPARLEKNGSGGGDDDNSGSGSDDDDDSDDDNSGSGSDDDNDADEDTSGNDDDNDADEDTSGNDDDDDADEDTSGNDDDLVDDSSVRLDRTESGRSVELRVRIEDGRITQLSVSRSDRSEREVRLRLQRTDAVADPNLEGKLSVESRDDRQRFKVEAEHADPGRTLEVFVIDTDGVEESQGLRTVRSVGEAEWHLGTSESPRLPFAAGSVADLEGMTVEVRDVTSGASLLRGTVPALPPQATDDSPDDNGGSTRERGRARLTAIEAGLQGHVDVRSRPEQGREELEIEAERLAPGRRVTFLVEDPGMPESFLELGTVAANVFGEAELERRTDKGHVLPGGAARVRDLEGLTVEIRDALTDDLLLTGTIPQALLD